MRQVLLDGSLEPLECAHRARRGREAGVLLRTGQVATVQGCRCGHIRFRVRSLRGELEWSTWAAAHAELPELPAPLKR